MMYVYLNGNIVEETQAKISIFDRGLLFSDSVYEVTAVVEGKLIDFEAHCKRLNRSCKEMDIDNPLSNVDILTLHKNLILRNGLTEGVVYLQITRGVTERNFIFPMDIIPTVFAFTKEITIQNSQLSENGLRIRIVPDDRWNRCDIKTTQLVAQSVAKTHSKRLGYDDAWMILENYITEGTSSNAFIVNQKNQIITRDLSNKILSGITRQAIFETAKKLNLSIVERPFTIEEALLAKEAFSTSASTFVLPVVEIDNKPIGSGYPGEIYKTLRSNYILRMATQ